MNHELIQEKLMALYDSPLTEKERKLLEGHMGQCPECRRAVAEWKALSQKLFPRQAFSEPSEDLFVRKVMNQLEADPPKIAFPSRGLALRWLFPLLGSAAVAAWVLFAVVPDSSDFNAANVETAFSSNDSTAASGGNGIVLASYSPSNELVP